MWTPATCSSLVWVAQENTDLLFAAGDLPDLAPHVAAFAGMKALPPALTQAEFKSMIMTSAHPKVDPAWLAHDRDRPRIAVPTRIAAHSVPTNFPACAEAHDTEAECGSERKCANLA